MTTAAESLRPTLEQERLLWSAGHHFVAGMDEVGRGAWAGPVTVGIAVLTPEALDGDIPRWLRDSKMLSELRREAIFDEVAGWCTAWSVGHAPAAECDRFGMTAALRLAGLRALGGLRRRMDAMLVDGPVNLLRPTVPVPDPATAGPASRRPPWSSVEDQFSEALAAIRRRRVPRVVVPVVDGDATCAAVAAASILAKVVRDRMMREEAPHFPPYDFDRNKGYPSPAHVTALQGYGLTAIHRRSWAFVDGLPWR